MTSSSAPRILIADDQRDVLEALRLLLKGEGFTIETATSPGAVQRIVETKDVDAVLMDMNYTRDTTSGLEGMDLISRLQTMDTHLPIVVMTAWGSVDGAVEAMRRGAKDYVEKPWDTDHIDTAVLIDLSYAVRNDWEEIRAGINGYTETISNNWSRNIRVHIIPISDRYEIEQEFLNKSSQFALTAAMEKLKPRGKLDADLFKNGLKYAVNDIPWRRETEKAIIIILNSAIRDGTFPERYVHPRAGEHSDEN